MHNYFEPGCNEYVILHAHARSKRGRNPSATGSATNPRVALKEARGFITNVGRWFPPVTEIPLGDQIRISRIIGVPPITTFEANTIVRKESAQWLDTMLELEDPDSDYY